MVRRVISQKETFLAKNPPLCAKRLIKPDNPQLEEALVSSVKEVRSFNIPIDGPTLIEKVKRYAADLNISDDIFKASNGWLEKFK